LTFSHAYSEQNRMNACWVAVGRIRGVGTGGGQGPQVFRKHKKCPFSGGKVPFAFVIAFCLPFHPPSATFPGKIFQVPFSFQKFPFETGHPPQSFDASYAPGKDIFKY
jgi:hypothetical protein